MSRNCAQQARLADAGRTGDQYLGAPLFGEAFVCADDLHGVVPFARSAIATTSAVRSIVTTMNKVVVGADEKVAALESVVEARCRGTSLTVGRQALAEDEPGICARRCIYAATFSAAASRSSVALT